MIRQGSAWWEAARVFLLSRLLLLSVTALGLGILPQAGAKTGINCIQHMQDCLLSWNYWDVYPYLEIAQHGYRLAQNSVFFPLWPLCIRLAAILLGGGPASYAFAALGLANMFCYLALVLFFVLAKNLYDTETARNSIFCLAVYPYAVFLFAGYSEALFLVLSLGMFLLVSSKKPIAWWLAGICAGLATLTRAAGIVLWLPFFACYIQRYWLAGHWQKTKCGEKVLAFLPLLLSPLCLAGYMLYLWVAWKNPFLFVQAERAGWGRHLSWPWTGLLETVSALLTGYQLVHNSLDLLFTLLPLLLLAWGWRRVPIIYSMYTLGMILFSLSSPSVSSEPLTSAPRYLLPLFPLFLLLGLCCRQPLFAQIYRIAAPVVLILFTLLFVHHYWLA